MLNDFTFDMVINRVTCKLCICIAVRNAIMDQRKLNINLKPVTRNNRSNGQSKRTQKPLRQTHLEKCSSLIQRCKLERLDCYYGALRSRCGHYILSLWFLLSILAALWNRAGHYIFPCGLYLSLFFPRIFSAVGDWMSAILPHMMSS